MKKSIFCLFLVVLSGVMAFAQQPCNASFTYTIDSANQHIVHFQSTSTPVDSLSYYWIFGNSTYSTTMDPTVTYTQNGTYTVCLIITSNTGCTDTSCAVITVPGSTSCTAYFTATPDTSNSLLIHFHDYSSPVPTTWSWSFGDNTTSTMQNPSHTYTQAGTYTVCLHITTATGCMNYYCHTLTVTNSTGSCTAYFNYTADSTNSLEIHFHDYSTGPPITWQWSFGDGDSSFIQHPVHIYAQAGTYTACLHITTASGCATHYCRTVTVTNNTGSCTAYFSSSPDSANSLLINFHDYSTPVPSTWYWSFGDNTTSTLQNPSHTYAQTGTYTVCLHITTATGCMNYYCHTLTVTNNTGSCTAYFNYTADSTNSLEIHFHDYSTGPPITWKWSFGDGDSSFIQNPVHVYAQAGTYTACLHITTANGCVNHYCRTVTVTNNTSSCQAYFTTTPGTVNPLEIHFHDYSSPVPVTWYWSFGDSTSSALQNPTHVYLQAGTYTVCLHITTANGCTNHFCRIIHVNMPAPCSNYITFYNQLLFYHFLGHATGGTPPYTYSWDFGDGNTSTLQNPTHTYAQAGTYTVTLATIDANGCSFTTTITVTANSSSQTYDLYGYVHAGAGNPLDYGLAVLYACNGANAYVGIDTAIIDTNAYYHFGGVPSGTYYIKAWPTPNSAYYGQYLPTYYPHNTFWSNATPIILGTPSNPYNITLEPVIPPLPGQGIISGGVIIGAKSTTSGTPVPGVEILLLNAEGSPEISCFSDNQGNFSFTNLDYGTYQVYAEVTGIPTYPAIVTLSGAIPAINNVSLVMTSTEVYASVPEIPASEQTLFTLLYPNPANDRVRMDVRLTRTQKVDIIMVDLLGQVVYSESRELVKGINNLNFNTAHLKAGSYRMQIRLQDGSLVTRKLSVIR